jgi:hypothetical protein
MPDPAQSFYQTLITAASEASAVLLGATKMVESVYLDYKPEVAPDIGQTLNVVLPANADSAVTDTGTGDFAFSTPTANTVPLVFSHHPSAAYTITDFSEWNTPADVRTRFLDAYLKGMLEYVNTTLCALAATANFTVNANITSASVHGQANAPEIQEADMANAWGQLAAQKVAVNDLGNFFTLTHPKVYGAMLGDSYWTANSQIGYQLAGQIRRYAMLGEQWGALIDYDQAMPTAVVSGTPNTTNYTSLVFHRYAMALAVRPLPLPQTNVVEASTIFMKGIPIRVMLGYNQLKAGWVTTVDCGFACGVIRPEMGVVITTNN